MVPSVVIVDHGTGMHPSEIALVALALQHQVLVDFSAPPPEGWGIAVTVRAETADKPIRDSEWMLGLFVDVDQPGALGYHDLTKAGRPMSKIFPLLDAQDRRSWSQTASHELLEMLVDPMLALCFQAPDGSIWAGEVCDAVEDVGYKIDSVMVSNFVLPSYFQLHSAPAGTKLDHLGMVTSPLQILPGGYGQTFTAAGGWTMHDLGQRQGRQLAAHARSRTIRRRYPVRPPAP